MSGSITPMAGMGSTGASLGSASMLTPQMIQMLLARARMGGMGAGQGGMMGPQMGGMGASPLAPSAAPTPMTLAMAARPPMNNVGPVPQTQAPQTPGQQPGAAATNPLASLLSNPQALQQILAQLKGGQNGINPLAGQGAANGIQNLLSGFSWGGIPGQGALNALSQQAAGNIGAGLAGI